ncbi:MAG: dienelactone hydrolase family protein [Acidimicrobiales bacterium]|jgi:dienelactone hydrolase|nr:dienelactone hydrolase family protein [Acidimicrobiales bacterium]
MALSDFRIEPFSHNGITHDVYRQGDGPCVLVVAEIPGITPEVIRFAEDVLAAGLSVAMPSMFGVPGRAPSNGYALKSIVKSCISSEFKAMATRDKAPATEWLRGLARAMHTEHGGPGVGFVGMCFTGGFGLAMLLDDAVVAPVLSQPSLPFSIGKKRKASVGLDEAQLSAVAERAAEGCAVMGLRFSNDPLVPSERFATLRAALGDNFIGVEITSPDEAHGIGKVAHSVLTEERSDEEGHPTKDSFDQVMSFLTERLHPA